MAIGFTPKHVEVHPLNELSAPCFLALGVETATELGWSMISTSPEGFIAYTNNGIFSFNAKVEVKIEGSEVSLKSSSTGSEMVDLGKNKKTIKKFLDKFHALQPTYSQEHLLVKYKELESSFVAEDEDPLKLPPATAKENFHQFLGLFKPVPGYFVTPILVNLNILVFFVMVCNGVSFIRPEGYNLMDWGANFRPAILDREWWRLITNFFLHNGILHLLPNLIALVFIGALLEPYLGKVRFITVYLATGAIASITSIWWHDNTISVGASGAIFGLYGVFLAMLTTNLIEKSTRKALLISIGAFVAYNLMYGMKAGIDNAAHIGGLLGGLLFGYAYVPGLLRPDAQPLKWGIVFAILGITFWSSVAVCASLPVIQLDVYQEKMKRFSAMEALALDVFRLPDTSSKADKLYGIKNMGIYYWYENIKLLEEADSLNLPKQYHIRNQKMREYCEVQIEMFKLLYKAVDEGDGKHPSEKYKTEITAYKKQVEGLIHELSGK